MKTNLKKELHGKSLGELSKQLQDTQSASRDLKMNHEQGKVKNTSQLARTRAEIAVIKTIMNEKLIAAKIEKDATAEGKKEKPASAKAKVKSASAKASADKEGGKNE